MFCIDHLSTALTKNTMRTPADVLENRPTSTYRGSFKTKEAVALQIQERWGMKEAKNFDPYHDVMTATAWFAAGFKIKKGEKALKSVTFIESEDADGHVTQKVRRVVNLFHRRQVEAAS